jgi:hypothetical protein
MPMTSDFCWRKAEQCHRLSALEADLSATKAFFVHSRESWIALANDLTALGEIRIVTHEDAWDTLIAGRHQALPLS